MEEQVVSIWAGTTGRLDAIEVADVLQFERELLEHLRLNTTVLETLRKTNLLDDATKAELERETDVFLEEFLGKGRAIDQPGHEVFAAAGADDVAQEQIVKGRRG